MLTTPQHRSQRPPLTRDSISSAARKCLEQYRSNALQRSAEVLNPHGDDFLMIAEDVFNVSGDAEDENDQEVTNSGGIAGHSADEDPRARQLFVIQSPESPARSLWTWQTLWGLIATNGSRKLTKAHYQSVRMLVDAVSQMKISSDQEGFSATAKTVQFGATACLPHYNTLQKNFRPLLLNSLAPRGTTVRTTVDTSKAGARAVPSSTSGQTLANVVVIPPSEYARADMATTQVRSQFVNNSMAGLPDDRSLGDTPTVPDSECIDLWPLVAAREWYYGQCTALHFESDCNRESSFAEVGDVVKATLVATSIRTLSERLSRCFEAAESSSCRRALQGVIIHTWNVHHSKRVNDLQFEQKLSESLSERDRRIVKTFSFVSYESPTDSVNIPIPEIPAEIEMELDDEEEQLTGNGTYKKKRRSPEALAALKQRREALKRKKAKLDEAWRNWVKPFLKPGDVIAMLGPWNDVQSDNCSRTLLTEVDRSCRLFVVTRFWTEQEERTRHMFWIDGGTNFCADEPIPTAIENDLQKYISPLCFSPLSLIAEIRGITVSTKHEGKRGLEKYTPVSSVGTLSSSESYFIYRFLIYWDEFEIQRGKSASGEGVYLLCLNLPVAARSSPSAIRVISVTPPGVSVASVFEKLIDDIVQGMTTGFVDYDAEGKRRRIFLDLVGFIGDTPALNQILDTLGHTGSACCHLCRFVRRSSTTTGSRYAGGGAHGILTSTFNEVFFHHAAC